MNKEKIQKYIKEQMAELESRLADRIQAEVKFECSKCMVTAPGELTRCTLEKQNRLTYEEMVLEAVPKVPLASGTEIKDDSYILGGILKKANEKYSISKNTVQGTLGHLVDQGKVRRIAVSYVRESKRKNGKVLLVPMATFGFYRT